MKRIEQLMRERGWNRTYLAHRSETDIALVGKIVNGRVQPYPVQLERLALALGYTGDLSDLLEEVEDGPAT